MAAKQPSPPNYDSFLSAVQPVIIALNKCNVSINRWKYYEADDTSKHLRLFRIEIQPDTVESDSFDLVASFSIYVRAVSNVDEHEQTDLLRLEGEYMAHFHTDESKPLSEAHIQRFAMAEARLVFLPYVRQLVTDLTSRMSIPPLMIPIQIGATTQQKRLDKRERNKKQTKRE